MAIRKTDSWPHSREHHGWVSTLPITASSTENVSQPKWSILSGWCISLSLSFKLKYSCCTILNKLWEYNIMIHNLGSRSCLTLWDLLDCSPPGSSVCGILQARMLEWVATSSSGGSSPPGDQTWVSCASCIAGSFFTHWAIREALLHLQWLKMLATFPVLCIFAIFIHSSLCEHGSGGSFPKRGLCSPHTWSGQISEADNPAQTVAKLPHKAVQCEPACLPRTQGGPMSLWLSNEWLQGCYHPLLCIRGPGHPVWLHFHFNKHIWKVPSNPRSWGSRRVCWSPFLVPQALAAGWVGSGTTCYSKWILHHHHRGAILGIHMLSLTEPRFWQLSENHITSVPSLTREWDEIVGLAPAGTWKFQAVLSDLPLTWLWRQSYFLGG